MNWFKGTLYITLIVGVLVASTKWQNWQAPQSNIALAIDQPVVRIEPRDPLAQVYPNIIIAAIQKSGSLYLKRSIMSGLNYTLFHNSDWKNRDRLIELANGHGMFSKEHFMPDDYSLEILRKYTDKKLVVHIRDPRQVLLSWVHHVQKEHIESNGVKHIHNRPKKFYSRPLAEQIDWSIDNRLASFVQWIEGWVAIKEREDQDPNGLRIMFTSYDELVADELTLYNKILDFYGIKHEHFEFKPPSKDARVHYRKGDQNEWRQVYSNEQKRKVAKIVPKSLLARFNWPE